MKDIFTYPNDAGTYYIDPDYVGDDTVGFQKRIKEIYDGDFTDWLGTPPTMTTHTSMMANISKYNDYYNSRGDNNVTYYDFAKEPLLVGHIGTAGCNVTSIETKLVTLPGDYDHLTGPSVVITTAADPAYQGDSHGTLVKSKIKGISEIIPTGWGSWSFDDDVYWAHKLGPNEYALSGLQIDQLVNNAKSMEESVAQRFGNGCWVRCQAPHAFSDGDEIRLTHNFDGSGHTGTANTSTSSLYVTTHGNYSFELFTDAARTVKATLTEQYLASKTYSYTNSGSTTQVIKLDNIDASDSFFDTHESLMQELTSRGLLFFRVEYSNFTGSTWTSPATGEPGTFGIPSSIAYGNSSFGYFYVGSQQFDIKDARGGSLHSFDLAPGDSVDITVHVIDPARAEGDYYNYMANAATTGTIVNEQLENRLVIKSSFIYVPGNATFNHLDATGALVGGAEISGNYYLPGDPTEYTLDAPIYTNADLDMGITVDSNGRINSAYIQTEGGIHDNVNWVDGEKICFPIVAKADLYVPPPTPPAELEDIFDTQDQWLDQGFAGGAKEFGRNIIPASAKITYNQPSTTNTSQSGSKYVRSAGFQRWKLDVEYRNLTKAQFQVLHAEAQSARGQATPFYLVHRMWGEKVLSFNNPKSTEVPRFIEDYTAGSTLLKLGGFYSNESHVFKKGEIVIGGQSKNGGIFTALNTVDANVYGEAHVRIAYSLPVDIPTTRQVYKNPHHVIVTLDSDNFEYTVDTFGLFNVNVGFDLGAYP